MKRILIIDIGRCTECLGCLELAPEAIRYNEDTGCLEVIDLDRYPEEKIREAMKCCPKDCIYWEEIP